MCPENKEGSSKTKGLVARVGQGESMVASGPDLLGPSGRPYIIQKHVAVFTESAAKTRAKTLDLLGLLPCRSSSKCGKKSGTIPASSCTAAGPDKHASLLRG